MNKVLWIFITKEIPSKGYEILELNNYSPKLIKNKENLYLFFNQKNVKMNKNSLKEIIISIYMNDEYRAILDNGLVNILSHSKQMGLNLSIDNNYSENPWKTIKDDGNMLEVDPYHEPIRIAEVHFDYLTKNKPEKDNDNMYTIESELGNIELKIDNFYIFRHEARSFCYQFIRKITNGEFVDKFPYDNKLEKKKNELIKLWLPLAIDIQGLSEVFKNKEKDKANKYWREIKESNKSFISLLKSHKKIANGHKKLKLNDSEEKKIKDFLIMLDNTDKEELPTNYLETRSAFFLPNWLEKFANKIN